jgi:hypothetical protein
VEKAAIESFRQRNVEGFVFATAHLKHPSRRTRCGFDADGAGQPQ